MSDSEAIDMLLDVNHEGGRVRESVDDVLPLARLPFMAKTLPRH